MIRRPPRSTHCISSAASDVYKRQALIYEINQQLLIKSDRFYQKLERLIQFQEERIARTKSAFTTSFNKLADLNAFRLSSITTIRTAFGKISSSDDLQLFLNTMEPCKEQPQFDFIELEEQGESTFPVIESKRIITFDNWSHSIENAEYCTMRDKLNKTLAYIIGGKPLSMEEKVEAIQEINTSIGKQVFADLLLHIDKPMPFPLESFREFGELVVHFLNVLAFHRDKNNSLMLATVLNLCENVHTKVDGRQQYLFTEVHRNGVWKEVDTWKELIQITLYEKVKVAKVMEIRRIVTSKKGTLKKFVNKFKAFVGNSHNDTTEIKKAMEGKERETIIWILKKFASYFINLKVDLDTAKKILTHFGKLYKVQHSVLKEMINAIDGSWIFVGNLSYHKECAAWRRTESKVKKCGDSVKCFGLKLSLAYVSDLVTLRNLLAVSKKVHDALKVFVYRQLLLKLNVCISLSQRVQIWEAILNVKSMKVNYEQLRAEVANENLLSKATEEVIRMDVLRSNNEHISKDSLAFILRSYAQYNKTIDYCQGINFLASYLYLIAKDEARTFCLLARLMEQFEMEGLFTKEVPLLKLCFDRLDNLIAIYCPCISEVLKRENVKCDFFASTWFLTVFTYPIQFTKEPEPPLVLVKIWDAFLTCGWKAVFRLGVFFVGEMEKRVFEGNCNLIDVLQSFSKREFVTIDVEKVVSAVNSIKITNFFINSIKL
eukprot:TRINITY_DN3257_c0_g6_i2.p1 TRINITY_DN3257_c0_g6~~TRINITY_DN3257_c0_g6_i2.p1  ORF type:complete len:723 (-),score=163.69 TRINITY_DN3257_c0_g6_i2:91-2238(-)